jgi:hypothetical protein
LCSIAGAFEDTKAIASSRLGAGHGQIVKQVELEILGDGAVNAEG